jgi:hypothetical protein
VGQRLTEARKRRNLTVAEIARSTKIPVHFLEAIERDDVDHMPPGFFARAFVRTYAHEVGVNANELLASVDPPVTTVEPEPEMPALPPPVNAPVSARSLLFVIPIVAVCGLYFAGRDRASTPSEAPPQVAAAIPASSVDRIDTAAAAASEATSDVELQIESRGGCIVSVTADGRTIPSGAVPPGESVVLQVRGEVVLRVGDAGACAPATKPNSSPKLARRPRIDAVPASPVVVAHVVDQEAASATKIVEPSSGASEAVLPQSDQPAPLPAIDQF